MVSKVGNISSSGEQVFIYTETVIDHENETWCYIV